MKISRFNIISELNDGILLYNTNTGAVIKIEDTGTSDFHGQMSRMDFSEDYIKELERGGFIVSDGTDEVDLLKISDLSARYSNDIFSLTIAPTMNCNFDCNYCYEKGREKDTMTKVKVDELVDFFKMRAKNRKFITVAWYGGEPLMCIDIIEELSTKFFENLEPEQRYTASIVTNGYLLTPEIAIKLRDLKVQNIQITLDGTKEIHDQRRMLHDKTGTFDKIFENIINCHPILPINIRVNVDKENEASIKSLVDLFAENKIQNDIGFYVAPVTDFINKKTNASCLTIKEFANVELDFKKYACDHGVSVKRMPYTANSPCGALSVNSFVVAPNGDLYKCWEHIGDIESCIGNVSSSKFDAANITKWILHDGIIDKECESCKVLPICLGGCPYQRIKFQRKRCNSLRFNGEKVLRLFENVV